MKRSINLILVCLLVCGVVLYTSSLKGEIKDLLATDSQSLPKPGSIIPDAFNGIRMPSDPFFDDFERQMDEMFKSFNGLRGGQMPDLTRSMHGYSQGRSDVRIEGDNVLVFIDLPGHEKGSIDLRIKNQELIVTSERKQEQSQEEKDKFFRREISYGSFSRVIVLPRKVIESGAFAEYQDGVLKVTLPIDKAAPGDEKGYKINIK